MKNTDDIRINKVENLISPQEMKAKLPGSDEIYSTVTIGRQEVENILTGKDSRPLIIIGPCSIHDPEAALEYAKRLLDLRNKYADKLAIVMRVYFEKPRTVVGWRGLIIDPALDGSKDIRHGLELGRKCLLDINTLGLPAASEVLDHTIPQYIADLISWAAIGARTTESQTHREMASGLSMPIGFKNGTDGMLDTAVNAIASSMHPHSFLGIDQSGKTVILHTSGNDKTHLILRGGKNGPNYSAADIDKAEKALESAGLEQRIMIDCSHANSGKKHIHQAKVFKSVILEIAEGRSSVKGLMVESNLVEGRQDVAWDDKKGCINKNTGESLVYGQSITDECIGWDETEALLDFAYNTL